MSSSLTLSLNKRTHLFVKDGRLFLKLHKQSHHTDKRDYSVVNDVSLDDAQRIYQWLGDVIAEHKQTQTINSKSIDDRLAEIKKILTQPTQEMTHG